MLPPQGDSAARQRSFAKAKRLTVNVKEQILTHNKISVKSHLSERSEFMAFHAK